MAEVQGEGCGLEDSQGDATTVTAASIRHLFHRPNQQSVLFSLLLASVDGFESNWLEATKQGESEMEGMLLRRNALLKE